MSYLELTKRVGYFEIPATDDYMSMINDAIHGISKFNWNDFRIIK